MSSHLKVNGEYLVKVDHDIVRIKVLEITSKCVRVHNLDEDFVKRYLLSDYKPEIIEEVSEAEDVCVGLPDTINDNHDEERSEILSTSSIPISDMIPSELYDKDEVWRVIPDMKHPYLLSNKGRIKNSQGKISSPYVSKVGTNFVGLTNKNGVRNSYRVDTLLNQIFGVTRKV